jgi:hypothetical protein
VKHKTCPEWLLIAGLATLALLARLVPGERTVDDAYITFRYTRNIVAGVGFAYNSGEHVLGTTTPLYTLLLVGLVLVTGLRDLMALALVINAILGAFSVGMLYTLGKRFVGHSVPATAAALLWAVAPFSVTFAIGGMETDLTIGLLLAAAYAHLTDRPRAMAVLTALALLARPDTAILLGLLWLDLILARRRIPWQEGLTALAILAPWLIFGTLTFGSPLTASIGAKRLTYRLPPEANLISLLQRYATPFLEHETLPAIGVFPNGVLSAFTFYCALSALGGLDSFRRHRRTWPLIAYPFAYFAVFAAANPLMFRWYFSPPMPFYFLLILAGVWRLARDLGKWLARCVTRSPRSASSIQHTVFALCAVAALTLTLNAWELHPNHGPDRPAPKMAWFQLELLYGRAAAVVRADAGPGDTLCAADIGMLGYATDMPILDTVGLVTPKSSNYYPADPDIYVINYAIPADLVLALDPDYIVILEVYGRLGLLPDPRFQARYQLLKKIETDIYGSDGMLIFARQ